MSSLVRRLFPSAGDAAIDPVLALDDLDPSARATSARPFVAINMVGSLDGAATLNGRSGGLSSDADRALFHGLRARFDAVLAGASTVRTERYGPIIPGAPTQPLAIIATASLELDPALPLLNDPESRVVVMTPSGGEIASCRADVSYARGRSVADMLRALRQEHGVRSLLCEGGPTLNRLLLQAEAVDELFLSLAPLLLGDRDGPRLVTGIPNAVELKLLWLLEAESHLHARYAVVSRVSSATTSSSSLAS